MTESTNIQYDYTIINKLLNDDTIKLTYEFYIEDIDLNNSGDFRLINYITTKYINPDTIIYNNEYILTITILNIYNNINNNIIDFYYDNKSDINTHYFFINSLILFLAEILYKKKDKLTISNKKFKDSNLLYNYLLTFFFNKINIGYINILLLLLNLAIINDNDLLNIYIKYIFNNDKNEKLPSFFTDKKFTINYEIKEQPFNNIDDIDDIDNFNIYNLLNLNLLYSYNNKDKNLILLDIDNYKNEFINILLNKFDIILIDNNDIYNIIFNFIYHYLQLGASNDS